MEINMTPAEGKRFARVYVCVESEGTDNPFPVPYICSVLTYCGSKKSNASPEGDNSPGKINAPTVPCVFGSVCNVTFLGWTLLQVVLCGNDKF